MRGQLTESGLLATSGEHAGGGVARDVSLVLVRTLTGVVRRSAPD